MELPIGGGSESPTAQNELFIYVPYTHIAPVLVLNTPIIYVLSVRI